MDIKKFLRPALLKIFIFACIAVFYLYFAKEEVCGAGLMFSFCYKAYGFPFPYLVSGGVDAASGVLKTSFLGEFFEKSGNFLINYAALFLDILLIYLASCLIYLLVGSIKVKN